MRLCLSYQMRALLLLHVCLTWSGMVWAPLLHSRLLLLHMYFLPCENHFAEKFVS